MWASEGSFDLSGFDAYFTVGETLGKPEALVPSLGLEWRHAPPPVAIDWWPVTPTAPGRAVTTMSRWRTSKEWFTLGDQSFPNDKRTGFLLDLPKRTDEPLELALSLGADGDPRRKPDEAAEKDALEALGWRVVRSVASTPVDYQRYVRSSKGEFSAAKPSCVRLQNAWISDRTSATWRAASLRSSSGRPSRLLPHDAGLFRFRDVDEAARALDAVAADYDRHSRRRAPSPRTSSREGV